MKRFLLLGITLMVSAAMLMTACKKDETNNGNNNGGEGTEAGYVDLGLPSGTKWKSANETGGYNGLYTFDEAVSAFGDKLPTKEQLEELKNNCTWEWQNNGGYKVIGTNGNSIVLSAAGIRDCDVNVYNVGYFGYYWSSTTYDSEIAWRLDFNWEEVGVDNDFRCCGQSVRLVKK